MCLRARRNGARPDGNNARNMRSDYAADRFRHILFEEIIRMDENDRYFVLFKIPLPGALFHLAGLFLFFGAGFFRIFLTFLQYFIVSAFEITENACIFLYRLFFHTDRTPELPAPIPGPARGEKELHT